MIVGLAVNALGYASVDRPLSPLTIFIALDIGTLLLLATTWRKTIIYRSSHSPLLTWRHFFGSLLLLLPALSAAGAMKLNNGGSNELTMIMFVGIAVAFIVLIMRPNLQRYYPAALFLFSLSILLSVSLRGWGITGHDIQREFNVFEMTMQQGMWDIAQFRDPYNACLSITLLPALLANITGIPDAYIFKVVFQFIAAFAIIPAYFFVRRLHGPRDALMAGFIFLLFPTFLNDMAMLNRQEIAFLFFGLIMLLMLLSVEYRRMQILTILLLIGLTLSHYSSSYIMVGLMLAAWLVHFIVVRITKPRFVSENVNIFPIMTLPIILFAGVFVFTWNDQITQTTKGLNSTISKTLAGINSDKKNDSQASDVGYGIFGQNFTTPQEVVNRFTAETTKEAVTLTAVEQPKLPVTSIGEVLGGRDVLGTIHSAIRNGIAKLLQILIAVGCIVLWWRIKQRKHGRYDLYVLSLCGSSTLLLVALTVLPQLSVDYGVLRLFQQLLFILALPIIAALVWFSALITRNIHRAYVSVASLLALIFLHTSGLIPQVTGEYAPQLALNNSGFYYDAYYTNDSERKAASWLVPYLKNDKASSVAFDAYAPLRFSDTSQDQLTVTSPFTPSTKAYVYHYKSPDIFIININSNLYYYKVERKTALESILYSNGGSEVGKLSEKTDE
jgi:uncharacterized membrane protein